MATKITWGSLNRFQDLSTATHLTMSEYPLVDDFLLHALRNWAGIGIRDVYEVNSKSSMDSAISETTVLPLIGEKWIVVVDVAKVRNHLKYFADNMRFGGTNVVWFRTSAYRDFKAVLENIKVDNVKYLTWLSRDEMEFLMGGVSIPDKPFNYLVKNYSREVDAPIKLTTAIRKGEDVIVPQDIPKLIGVSSGTIDNLVFRLLNLRYTSKTARGASTQEKGIVKSFVLLLDKMPLGKLRTQLLYTSRDLLAIKMLYLSGSIYDYVPKEIEYGPYKDLRLSKYNRHLDKIKEMDLARLQFLYLELKTGNRWSSPEDMVGFLYKWFDRTVAFSGK